MTELLLINSVILVAAFTQSITGFGFSLVAMSLLPTFIGIQSAAPLVSLLSIASNIVLWLCHRQSCDLKIISRLAIAALAVMPIGILAIEHIPEALALRSLGVLILSYVLYDYAQWTLPAVKSLRWAYVFGSLSGLLSGAYNIGGPPVVIYGNCSGWSVQTAKSNLSGFFLINAFIVALGHAAHGNLTALVWRSTLFALPTFGVGLTAGIVWGKNLSPATFKRATLILLALTGLNLVL